MDRSVTNSCSLALRLQAVRGRFLSATTNPSATSAAVHAIPRHSRFRLFFTVPTGAFEVDVDGSGAGPGVADERACPAVGAVASPASGAAGAAEENIILECTPVVHIALSRSVLFCCRLGGGPAGVALIPAWRFPGVSEDCRAGSSLTPRRWAVSSVAGDASTTGQANPVRDVKSGR